jgi:hypothetical protein
MLDNRLDFINKIEPHFIDAMTAIRAKFIELDEELQRFEHYNNFSTSGAARTVAIARTNIEIACQYAIKSLCLCGEIKEC